jgi:amino acid transporter
VLSVRAAFVVGWVLWFAYIVAGVLYALASASFLLILSRGACDALGLDGSWLAGRNLVLLVATLATAMYSYGLVRKSAGGGQWVSVAKIVIFLLLIAAGLIAFVRKPLPESGQALLPFFSGGLDGLIAATGLTFVSLQGFEMISAIAGEVRDPQKTIPRSIFLSLGISFWIYLPLLILVATAGVGSGESVVSLAAVNPETVVATAARRFLGEAGYWFVITAVALATLSALQANLLTASRVAHAMAHDHTLPSVLERSHPTRGTPVMALFASALTTVAIMFMLPDVTSAGAATGLIFLLAFSLTHLTAYLARKRSGPRIVDGNYRTPLFPLVPIVGGLSCAGLAVFQAIVVPDAGAILVMWLGLGVILYVALFKGRAEVADVAAAALDPRLHQLRGKSPLVLLPIANPRNARSMVEVANALAPSEFARVLLLTIVRAPRGDGNPLAQLDDAQAAVREALGASYAEGHAPEALITAAAEPWSEIKRVAAEHGCESLLLGLPKTNEPLVDRQLEDLMNQVDCDVAVMRAPDDWRISSAKRVLVAVGGRGEEHELRARLLATLCREMPRDIVFLTVVPSAASDDDVANAVRMITRLTALKLPVKPTVEVVRSDDPAAAIVAEAARSDLLILGIRRSRQGRKVFGSINRGIAFDAPCAVILLSNRDEAMTAIRDVIPWTPRRADTSSD